MINLLFLIPICVGVLGVLVIIKQAQNANKMFARAGEERQNGWWDADHKSPRMEYFEVTTTPLSVHGAWIPYPPLPRPLPMPMLFSQSAIDKWKANN